MENFLGQKFIRHRIIYISVGENFSFLRASPRGNIRKRKFENVKIRVIPSETI